MRILTCISIKQTLSGKVQSIKPGVEGKTEKSKGLVIRHRSRTVGPLKNQNQGERSEGVGISEL